MAVLPLASLGAPQPAPERLRDKMDGALVDKTGAQVLRHHKVDSAVRAVCGREQDRWDCLKENENLFEVGKRLEADVVVAGQLAAMGEMHALKLRVADVTTSTVSAEIVTSQAGDDQAFLAGLLRLHERVAPKEPDPRWYERWETWTIAGAAVAVASGIVLVLVLGSGSNSSENLDFDWTLP